MNLPAAQTVLAGIAMIILGVLSGMMAWHPVPVANHDYMIFILGALSGALTVGGAAKIADSIATTDRGPATVQGEPKGDGQ